MLWRGTRSCHGKCDSAAIRLLFFPLHLGTLRVLQLHALPRRVPRAPAVSHGSSPVPSSLGVQHRVRKNHFRFELELFTKEKDGVRLKVRQLPANRAATAPL